MARIPRIPRTINEFNNYLTNTAAYMQQATPPNATRLGLSDAEIARWEAYRDEWSPLYLLYSDKKNSRTTAVRDQLVALIESVVEYDRTNHIVDRIASSPTALLTDYETFRIKSGILKKSSRTVPSAPITEQVSVTLLPVGGGMPAVCRSCIRYRKRRSISLPPYRTIIYGKPSKSSWLRIEGKTGIK